MEGLLIAQALGALRARLPARRLPWRFPDRHTAVLPLVPQGALWLFDRPPNPRLEFRDDQPVGAGASATRFQELLRARAEGPLLSVHQPALDRVARLQFGGAEGFVETPPVELVVELTGRNGNLILLDAEGIILGASREIGSDVNRFREIRAGLRYVPPPPYDKLDPRTASRGELARALRGRTLPQVKRVVDGVGPELTAAASALAALPGDARLEDERLERLLDALSELVADPTGASERALDRPDVATLRAREQREADAARVAARLRERIELTEKRIRDSERTVRAAAEAARLREEADLLLAHAGRVPAGASRVVLPGFDGEEVALDLDPATPVPADAERRYQQARKREMRAERAEQRAAELEREAAELSAELAGLPGRSDEELARRAEELAPQRSDRGRRGPGLRYPAPHGFTVVVGRNARENDEITFRLARSRDLWLHVQGWHGSHVIVLTDGREVPFDTLLFAARLAAGHSKASGGDNVPVDYALRKHVWKVKGGPPGAVRFTQQKTVYVTPSRNPGAERA